MSDFYSDPMVINRLNNMAFQVRNELQAKLKKTLARKKFRNTGALLDSIRVTVKKADGQDLPSIHISFNAYGRIIDMKKLYWTQQPPLQELQKWLDSGGLKQVNAVPGYAPGSVPLISREKINKRIAYAIAVKKRTSFSHTPKAWKNKNIGPSVARITYLLAEEFSDIAGQVIAEQLSNKR